MVDWFEIRNSTFDIGLSPDDGRKFTELYNVQHLQWSSRGRCDMDLRPSGFTSRRASDQSAQLDRVSRVCISTIQRLYSMMRSLFFWIETLMPEDQFTPGDRPRFMRVQRSVWNALGSAVMS
jgi:hypothetical protein